ncbi:MAG: VTT domain-containing protein [Candidatus Gracilibacteria bacterium]
MDLSLLATQFANHPIILFFVLSFIAGEEVMIPLAFLVGQGLWDLPTLFITFYVSTFLSDIAWFLFGKYAFKKATFFKKFLSKYQRMKLFISNISKNKFRLLLTTKFLYGTRIFTIMYTGTEGTSLPKFMGMNAIVIAVWLPVIVGLGWLAGRGSGMFFNLYEHTSLVILAIGIIFISIHLIHYLIAKYLLPKELRNEN